MKKMSLTERIYGLEYSIGVLFYGVGILLLTPPTNNQLLKNLIISAVCLVGLVGAIYQFRSSKEKIDERDKNNFIKASNITLLIISTFLVIVVDMIQLLSIIIKLNAWLILFVLYMQIPLEK